MKTYEKITEAAEDISNGSSYYYNKDILYFVHKKIIQEFQFNDNDLILIGVYWIRINALSRQRKGNWENMFLDLHFWFSSFKSRFGDWKNFEKLYNRNEILRINNKEAIHVLCRRRKRIKKGK